MKTQLGCAAAIAVGLGAILSIGVGPSAAAQRTSIMLTGSPALLNRHITDTDGNPDYKALARVASTLVGTYDVTVDFMIMQGGTVVGHGSQTAGIRPGGGIVSADFSIPKATAKAGGLTITAHFESFVPAIFASIPLDHAKIVGTPKLIVDHPTCSMTVRMRNPYTKALDAEHTNVTIIGLRKGKIVDFAETSLDDDLAPGATVRLDDAESIGCAKPDQIRAFVQAHSL